MTWLQRFLLRLYAWTVFTGILKTGWGQRAFLTAYTNYKSLIEARHADQLKSYVQADSVVIDVGANIGFFTLKFAHWVSGRGSVIAIEPEPVNVVRLRSSLARVGLESVVTLIEAAATDRPGQARLVLDASHPANHHLGPEGIAVEAVSLDDVLEASGLPIVSLIKIDVQGAEMLVLRGAQRTLDRCEPALYVEVFDEGLRAQGSSAEELLEFLSSLGYRPYRLAAHGIVPAAEGDVAGYGDLLFVRTRL